MPENKMSTAILAFLTALVGTGGFAAILQTIRWYKDRKDDPVQQGLIDVSKVYDNLQRVKSVTKAARAVLLKLHNGGGRPQVGHLMYSSMIYESYGDDEASMSHSWQQERIDNDSQYREMLITMLDSGCVMVETENMPECKLKDTYIANGVVRAIVKDVGKKKNEHYYLSVSFHSEEGNPHIENDAVRICASRIKRILDCD
jgi:hypothetical protein